MNGSVISLTARLPTRGLAGRSIRLSRRSPVALVLVAAAAVHAQDAQRPTFKAGTLLIEVDVRATDKKHQFVGDLTASDFQLLDDGQRQEIATCVVVTVPRTATPASTPAADAPPIGQAAAPGAHDGRTYLIVLDDLHVEPSRTRYAVKTASQFVDKYLLANDTAAVIYTSGRGGLRQPFTGDRALLHAAIDAFSGSGLPPPTLTEQRGNQERIFDAAAAMRTIGALAHSLDPTGHRRKALLFISEGVDFDYTALHKYPDALEVIEAAQEAVAAAAAAHVTIYAVDPRGATQLGDDTIEIGSLPRAPQAAVAAASGLQDDIARSQSSLRGLADQTGGFATVNQNDASKAFQRIVDENSEYYVLGYNAPADHQDGKAHKVEVHVTRRGVDGRGGRTYVLAKPRS